MKFRAKAEVKLKIVAENGLGVEMDYKVDPEIDISDVLKIDEEQFTVLLLVDPGVMMLPAITIGHIGYDPEKNQLCRIDRNGVPVEWFPYKKYDFDEMVKLDGSSYESESKGKFDVF